VGSAAGPLRFELDRREVTEGRMDALEHAARTHEDDYVRLACAHTVWSFRPDRAKPILEDALHNRRDTILESTHRCSSMGSTDTRGGRVARVPRARTVERANAIGETLERVSHGLPRDTLTHAVRRRLVGVCDAPVRRCRPRLSVTGPNRGFT